MTGGRLLDRLDSLLLVIDAQPGFYRRISGPDGSPPDLAAALDRAAWLAGVAAAMQVPAVLTEEDADRNGPTVSSIESALPADTPKRSKHVFGAADQDDILAAIRSTGRRTVVVVGLETDVCVVHTALGLLDHGFRVAVVEDATYAPGEMHSAGIRRVAGAGGTVIHAKGVYYEWIRTLDAARAFERDHPQSASPPGFDL
jgi:nicotinamidase-related amidase